MKLLDDLVPIAVRLWTSNTLSFIQRDFRLLTCLDYEKCLEPVFWYEQEIEPTGGIYEVSVQAQKNGWTGFLIELVYNIGGNQMTFTTEANIVPDRMPYPFCGDSCQ